MSDLYELLKRRQDELRGRPEDWIDRLFDRARRADWAEVAIVSVLIPNLVLLIVIQFMFLLKLVKL